jgi:hypothetical protein
VQRTRAGTQDRTLATLHMKPGSGELASQNSEDDSFDNDLVTGTARSGFDSVDRPN